MKTFKNNETISKNESKSKKKRTNLKDNKSNSVPKRKLDLNGKLYEDPCSFEDGPKTKKPKVEQLEQKTDGNFKANKKKKANSNFKSLNGKNVDQEKNKMNQTTTTQNTATEKKGKLYEDRSSFEDSPKTEKKKVQQLEQKTDGSFKANKKKKAKSNLKSLNGKNVDQKKGKTDETMKGKGEESTNKKPIVTKSKKTTHDNLPLVLQNNVDLSDEYDSDYDFNYDFDDDYDYFDSSIEDYSDDSDEFTETSDSFDWETSDDSDYENDMRYGSDCYAETDPDYELPPNVPEDLVIHKGTASKCDLDTEHELNFESDNDEPQVIEIVEESKVTTIKQPVAYSESELQKLNQKNASTSIKQKDARSCNHLGSRNVIEKECPALIPIVDDDASCISMEMYSNESEYISDSSSSSNFEEDINIKYLQATQSSCDDDGSYHAAKRKKTPFKIGIVNVKNCIPQKNEESVLAASESQRKIDVDDIQSEQLPSKSTGSPKVEIITVSICDKEAFNDAVIENDMDGFENFCIPSPEISNTCSEEASTATPCASQLHNESKIVAEQRTIRTMFINAVNSNFVLVLLKDALYLYGTVCMTLIAGQVDVYGYKPHLNEQLEIFSPRGCSTVEITLEPSTKAEAYEKIADKLKPLLSSFSLSDLESIENAFEGGRDAILLLKRNMRRRKIKNIFKNYMNENVFPNMRTIQTFRPFYASEYQLDCVINAEAEKCLRIPAEWKSLSLATNSKMLLAGGKSVGKSTLLRYLLNRQLEYCKEVLVIDLDIGQAELFVPQTISCTVLSQPLLGPGFFLNHQPKRAYAVGHSNVVLCAHAYIRAVKHLIDYCYSKEEFAEIPWLINTMGYNKGFGMELMSILVRLIRPTAVVQLQSNKEINNFDDLLHPNVLASIPRTIYNTQDVIQLGDKIEDYELHVFKSAVMQESRYQRDWEMSAKDLRYATFLSRLSDILQGNAEWLTDCVPLSAPIEKVQLVSLTCKETANEDLVHTFEGNLVYLCRKNEQNHEPLECFGIGIVRCIDLEKIYLLPAILYEALSKVNCLALGEMPLPSSLFTNQGPKVRGMAAFLYNTKDTGTTKSIKQIYHRPSRFLTGKHKNALNDI